jgi:hypothetical protein
MLLDISFRLIKAGPLRSTALTGFLLPMLSGRTVDWYDEPRGADTWYADVSTIDVAIILEDDHGLVPLSQRRKTPALKT